MRNGISHAYADVMKKGNLSSLTWLESPLKHLFDNNTHKELDVCAVHYSSINFRDVMVATGRLPVQALPGRVATLTFAFSSVNILVFLVTLPILN